MLQRALVAVPLALLVGLVTACDSDSKSSTDGKDGGGGAPAVTSCSGKTGALGSSTITLTGLEGPDGGGVREALVRIPSGYDATKPTELVLNFHGLIEPAELQETVSHMTEETEKRGIILVYPKGLSGLAGASWNAGDCCGNSYEDVAFIRRLVTKLEDDYCIDTRRVFATGLSNGAMMTYRLACEAADVFAAAAPVAGAVVDNPCTPSRPVPILAIHGTGDTIVPFNGGVDGLYGLLKFPPLTYSTTLWRNLDGCPGAPATPGVEPRPEDSTPEGGPNQAIFDGAKSVFEKGDSACYSWTGCKAGSEVELCTVVNGGHGWPGGEPLVGKSSTDLISTAAILDFFDKHPMP